MFGFGKKSTAPVAVQETPYMSISDEKLDSIKAILTTVGLDEDDAYGFALHAKKKDSYNGGTFEWTIREQGVRFWVNGYAPSGRITSVEVGEHNGWTPFTAEQFAEANRKLAALFV